MCLLINFTAIITRKLFDSYKPIDITRRNGIVRQSSSRPNVRVVRREFSDSVHHQTEPTPVSPGRVEPQTKHWRNRKPVAMDGFTGKAANGEDARGSDVGWRGRKKVVCR